MIAFSIEEVKLSFWDDDDVAQFVSRDPGQADEGDVGQIDLRGRLGLDVGDVVAVLNVIQFTFICQHALERIFCKKNYV